MEPIHHIKLEEKRGKTIEISIYGLGFNNKLFV